MKTFLLPLLIGACLLVVPQWAWAQPSNSSNPQVLCFGTVEPYCVDCTENSNTGTAGSTYVWTVSAATATIQPNPAFPAVQPNPIQGNHILIDWGTTPVGNYTLQVVESNADGCAGLPMVLNIQIQQIIALASTPVNPTCGLSNGSITLGAVTGGTAPYTYSINGSGFTSTTSYTGLAAGSYTFIVRDTNGCEFTANPVTLTNEAGPTALASTPVDPTCGLSNGSIALGAVTGGTGPYTYSFNGSGFTATTSYPGLAAGSYAIIVRDVNGCEYPTSVSLTNQAGPTALASTPVDPTCGLSNGSIALGAVTGGTGPYTYSFNGSGFTATTSYPGLAAGSYAIIVRDVNGCEYPTSVTLTNQAGPTAVVTTIVDATCDGASNGSITLGAVTGGVAPYTYSFNGSGFTATTSYTGLAAGNYTIVVRDANGCEYPTAATIAEPLPFTVDVTAGPQICFEGSAIFTFSGGPANGTVNITVDGVAQTITLDGSGAFSLIVNSAIDDVDVDVVNVSDGTCTYDVTDSGTVIVSPEIQTSDISHD